MFRSGLYALALTAVAAFACNAAAFDTAAVDRVVAGNGDTHGIPAQAVVVVRDGEVVYRGFGGITRLDGGVPVDRHTVFQAFSVGKLFAATLLLQQVEQGRVELEAPASRYLSDLPSAWQAITVEQFLSHTSGVPEYFDPDDLAQPFPASLHAVFEALADVPVVEPAGTRTRYTATNFLVIAAILEAVTASRYADLVRDRITAPLGLRNTWLGPEGVPHATLAADYHGENGRLVPDAAVSWPAYSAAHGNLYSTADDIAAFLSAVAQGRLVSRKSLLRYWKPYAFPNGNTGYFAAGWEYGASDGLHEVGHDGGAKVRVRIVFHAELDDATIIVYLTNGSRDGVWSRTLVESVQRMVLPR